MGFVTRAKARMERPEGKRGLIAFLLWKGQRDSEIVPDQVEMRRAREEQREEKETDRQSGDKTPITQTDSTTRVSTEETRRRSTAERKTAVSSSTIADTTVQQQFQYQQFQHHQFQHQEVCYKVRKDLLIDQLTQQACKQQAELQNLLWLQFFFLLWLQGHYQQFVAAQLQQYTFNCLFQQYRAFTASSTMSQGSSSGSDADNLPAVTPVVTPVPPPPQRAPTLPSQPIIAYPLPLAGTPGAPPTFDGRNVSSFLKKYASMCDNYGISAVKRVKRVSEYCTDEVARDVEAFAGWKDKDWAGLVKEMKTEWRREDAEQIMYTRAFLEQFVRQPRKREGLKHYCRQFSRISTVLAEEGQLDAYSQGRLFIDGLPDGVKQKVLLKNDVSAHAVPGSINYTNALKTVEKMVKKDETLEYFIHPPEEQTGIINLARSLNVDRQPAADFQVQFPKSEEKATQPKEDMMEQLSKSFNALALPLTTAINRLEATATSRPVGQGSMQRGLDPALENRQFRRQPGDPVVCYICDQPGHTKPNCEEYQQLIREGKIHEGLDKRACLGPRREGAMPVMKYPGLTVLQTIKKHLSIKGLDASVNYIVASVEDDTDEEVDSWDRPMATVGASRADIQRGKRPVNRPAITDPVKDARNRATKHAAQKENAYPTMKSLRTGVYEPEGGEASGTVEGTSQREETVEAEGGEMEGVTDSRVSAKSVPKIVKTSLKKLLAGHADPLNVIDRILQQPLTIS